MSELEAAEQVGDFGARQAIEEPIEADHVLIVGNPVDGFTFYGPFAPNDAEFEAWLERNVDGDWWYARLRDWRKETP